MAWIGSGSMRSVLRYIRETSTKNVHRRWTHSGTSGGSSAGARARPTLITAAAVTAGSLGAYVAYRRWDRDGSAVLLPVAHAAAAVLPASQPSVYSATKDHALFLWIHLSPKADAKACAQAVANLQDHTDAVSPADLRDEDNEIIAGVGFGPDFYAKLSGTPRKKYEYRERRGPLGSMPKAGGDIFIHAKSNSISKLFELAQRITSQLPPGSIDKFEDIYSFVYRNGRDLSGFIDGTENPADEEDRRKVAVEPETGGSYVITQKWVHRLDTVAKEKKENLEKFVGRSLDDSIEHANKSVSSHVARMTGGTALDQKKDMTLHEILIEDGNIIPGHSLIGNVSTPDKFVFQIVRQSMPYGNLHDKAGLFFIAYAASPENFDYMLDRMVGADKDGHSDDIMRVTTCVASTYWYFPSPTELLTIRGGNPRRGGGGTMSPQELGRLRGEHNPRK